MNNYPIEVIVLVGGLGTRLRGMVPDLPKPMAPVAGRPFLEHILDRLKLSGVSRVILSVGYLSNTISTYFGTDYCGMEITYAYESEPLGTGGAIAYALSFVRSDYALVLNGDTYLDINYEVFVNACIGEHVSLGIVVRCVKDTERYGRCELKNNIVVRFGDMFDTGSGLINAGVYCVSRDIFSSIVVPKVFSFEQDFLAKFLIELRPLGFTVNGYFIDIGIPGDYVKAQVDFSLSGVMGNPGAAN